MVHSLTIASGSLVSEAFHARESTGILALFVSSFAARGYQVQFATGGNGLGVQPTSGDFASINTLPFGQTIPTPSVVHSGAGNVWGVVPFVPVSWARVLVSSLNNNAAQSVVVYG